MNITGLRPSHADIKALQQIDLGERLKPAEHSRDDHDLSRLNRLQERADRLLRKQTQDDAALYLPITATSALAQDIGHHFRNQRRYDHTVGLDQVSQANFTQRRSAALQKIPGAKATALQYGQSFAADLDKEPPYPRLRISNDPYVVYHREIPGKEFHSALKTLHERKFGSIPNGYDVAFVNSGHSVSFLRSLLAGVPDAAKVPLPKEVASGIIALYFPPNCAQSVGHLITVLGANPSAYQIKRALSNDPTPLPRATNVDNTRIIGSLMASNMQAPSRRLRLASPTEGTGAMAHTAADLVDDLCNVLVKSGLVHHHRQNPLLAQGLVALHGRLEDMNALHNDSARFGNAYRAMMEEMHVILTATRPYTLEHFKAAALHHLESTSRMDVALASQLKMPETYLATSAMNAIWQGLEVAAIASGEAIGSSCYPPHVMVRHRSIMKLISSWHSPDTRLPIQAARCSPR